MNIYSPIGSPLRNYTIGSTVTVPELPKRSYNRGVIVLGYFANVNGLMLMPTFISVTANSQQLTVSQMWNCRTDSLQTSGSFDIRVIDVEYV